MADKFKIGDVVSVKGINGPKMSVSGKNHYDDDKVDCVWFAGSKKQTESFHIDALELVPEPDAKP